MSAGDGLEHTVLSGSKRPTGVDGARPQNDPHRSLYDGLVGRRFLFRRSFDRSAAIANVEPSRRHRFRRLVGGETLRRRRLPPATERPLPPPPPLRSPTDDATDATDRRLLPAASLGSRRSFRRRFCVQSRQYHVLPLFALQSVRICRKRSADDRFLPSALIVFGIFFFTPLVFGWITRPLFRVIENYLPVQPVEPPSCSPRRSFVSSTPAQAAAHLERRTVGEINTNYRCPGPRARRPSSAGE